MIVARRLTSSVKATATGKFSAHRKLDSLTSTALIGGVAAPDLWHFRDFFSLLDFSRMLLAER